MNRSAQGAVAAALAAGLICGGLTPASAVPIYSAGGVQERVAQSLEQYRRGDFDNAVHTLIGPREVRSMVGEFRGRAGVWIDSAPANDRHARTLVAAAMSIEVVAATFLQHLFDYEVARDLIEWSCGRMSKFPPVDAERWIHLAFIALAQGARDDSALTGNWIAVGGFLPATGPHAEHAGRRFPREGRFKLAHVTAVWQAQQLTTFPLPPDYLFKNTAGGLTINDVVSRQLDVTLQLLAALFDDPQVGPEARLRSGVLKFQREDPEAGEDLRHAGIAQDPAVRSLAHLMLGTIADRAGDGQEALRRYRLAYEAVPSSASSVALASRLFRSGQHEEAAAVQRAFDAAVPAPDPWDLYGQRDYRFFGAYRQQVRRALAK